MGDKVRARTWLQDRLARMPLSELMKGLMASLATIVDDRFDDAFHCMQAMTIPHEPEVLIYLARHYSYIGSSDSAVKALKSATQSGFVCAPDTLGCDPWLNAARAHRDFGSLLAEAESSVDDARSVLRTCGARILD